MSEIEIFVGWFSGLRLLDPGVSGAELWATLFVIHTCDAFMCRLFARNNGYSKPFWFGLGLAFGIWAMAVLLLLPKREGEPAALPAVH